MDLAQELLSVANDFEIYKVSPPNDEWNDILNNVIVSASTSQVCFAIFKAHPENETYKYQSVTTIAILVEFL